MTVLVAARDIPAGTSGADVIDKKMLKQQTGISLTHVPYKGGGPAAIAVVSGEIAAMFGGGSVV